MLIVDINARLPEVDFLQLMVVVWFKTHTLFGCFFSNRRSVFMILLPKISPLLPLCLDCLKRQNGDVSLLCAT